MDVFNIIPTLTKSGVEGSIDMSAGNTGHETRYEMQDASSSGRDIREFVSPFDKVRPSLATNTPKDTKENAQSVQSNNCRKGNSEA